MCSAARFSKLIHLCWFQGIDQAPEATKRSPAAWKALNPHYEVVVWDEHSLTQLIQDRYPALLAPWRNLDKVIKKCDVARMLVVHAFGGIYADLDLKPRRALDSFLDDPHIQHLHGEVVTGSLPSNAAPPSFVRLRERDFLLSKEYKPIDSGGSGVANGLIITKPGVSLWLDFVHERMEQPTLRVLDFAGPHALTRFIRQRHQDLRGKGLLLPPYYFLWERHAFVHEPPAWCVTEHLAVNNWGDHTRADWWNV